MVDKHIDVDRYKIKQNETVNLHNIPTFCDIAIEKNEVKQIRINFCFTSYGCGR